jgi:lipoprotein-anchoring transpeptidase ErfK/SrfK
MTMIIVSAVIVLLAGIVTASALITTSNAGAVSSRVSIAGIDVSGLSVKDATVKISKDLELTVKTADGGQKTIPYHDAGVTADVNAAVQEAIKPRSLLSLITVKNIPLTATVDRMAMRTDLNTIMVGDHAVKDAFIEYRNGSYIVNHGKSGKTVDVDRLLASMGTMDGSTLTMNDLKTEPSVKIVDDGPAKSNDLNDLAGKANSMIKLAVTIGPRNATSDEIAAWLKISGGKIIVDKNAVNSTIRKIVAENTIQQKPATIMMTPDGKTKIATTTYGEDGSTITFDADAADSIVNAVNAGKSIVVKSEGKTIPAVITNVNAPGDFTSPNGSHWMKVDLSTQTVYAYAGSTLVRTMNSATGEYDDSSKVSDDGTFYVNIKMRTQTMRGPGYVTPNVPWISYYNGGEGFHGAPWNTYNIAHGISSSHGCINMSVSDAKWVYDFAPIGTKVEVVGTTPAGSVR